MKYEQIKKVFTNLNKLKQEGIWFSGKEGEGEYKEWWESGQLWEHCFYKHDNEIGEYKRWYENGQLSLHCFYRGIKNQYYIITYQGEDDKRFKGKYKKWSRSGKLREHIIFNNDGSIKEIIK